MACDCRTCGILLTARPETEYLSNIIISCNLAVIMFSKFPSYLYQKKRKMNVTFAQEFSAFTNSGQGLLLERSYFIVDNQSACSLHEKYEIQNSSIVEARLDSKYVCSINHQKASVLRNSGILVYPRIMNALFSNKRVGIFISFISLMLLLYTKFRVGSSK